MDNIAGLLSLFLIGAAFLSSCNAPQAPGGSGSEPVLLMSR
jgi:predicted small secreted protein